MIARRHRFHGYNALRHVYQHGRQVRGTDSSLKVLSNERRHDYRLAVVVSRKVNKSAVVRNRIRRRIYELVRAEEANILESFDMVFTVYSDHIAALTPSQLHTLVQNQLKQAGVIKK